MAPSGNSHLFSGFESPPPAQSPVAGPSLLVPPSLTITGATPDPSPVDPPRGPSTPKTEKSKGKRKAEEVEGGTPPDMKKEKGSQRATFSTHDPRPHRASATSGSSHAPSSYHRKRARISDNTFSDGPPSRMASVGESPSRPPSRSDTQNGSFGPTGRRFGSQSRASSQPPPKSPSSPMPHRSPSRRSLSQASIPISALISPHAPSVSHRSARFHMRDPRRPAPVRSTPWALSFPRAAHGERSYFSGWTFRSGFSRLRGRGPSEKLHGEVGWIAGGGSPLHAWLFFFGFVVFPLWWVASFLAVPETRRLGGGDAEKGVVLDDPQVEFDSHSWRKRCRIMGAVSLVTYLPFIILVAIFAP